MRSTDDKCVFEKTKDGAQALLPVNDFTRGFAGAWFNVLTHVKLRNWLASNNRIDQI
jgi:hypothetical protein